MSPSPPVSLVTGSVRGLGLAVARAMGERGDRVHLVWNTSRERAAERETEFSGRVHQADLADAEETARLVREVLQTDGRLDHVVHCVGDYVSATLEETTTEDWRWMLRSNLESAIHLAAAVREELRRSKVFFGCAGLSELRGRRRAAAYAAAKSALLVFARSLALEEAPHGVRVNTLSPGLFPHPGAHPETSDPELLAHIPLGRAGELAEVAAAALWLSSGGSSYVVGADLPVSGGWLL